MIKVVNGLCGSGKSTRMLEMINNSVGDVRWLFITPFLTEVNERVPKATPNINWHIPTNKGKGKLGDLHKALKVHKDIVSTHALFHEFTKETIDLVIDGNYTLVIDESIDCIGKVDKQICNGSDVQALITSEMVFVHDDKSVTWNEDKYPDHDGKYSTVRQMCQLGVLQMYRERFIMWQYPEVLLSQVKECYILTYMFQSSTMRSWLDLKDISYEYVSSEDFGLRPEEELKAELRANLEIVDNRALNALYKGQTQGTFSNSWYKSIRPEKVKQLKALMRSAVVSNGLKQGDIFWTSFKVAERKLQGVGYTKGASKEGTAFIPFNIKATNEFKDHKYCIYGVNLYKDPTEVEYMRSLGVEVDSSAWSTSEMIQFVYRGACRQNKPMKLMIFSKRMRRLFEEWLYEGVE